MNDKQFGQWIRKTRKEHGMTQHKLAEIIGIKREYISMAETGQRKLPERYDEKLAEAFRITIQDVQYMRNQARLSEVTIRVETSDNIGVILNGSGTYMLIENKFGDIEKIRIHEEDRSKLRDFLTE